MELTDEELDLVLAGLFELTITYVEDDEKSERCKALARKLGGDPDAMFFGAQARHIEALQPRLPNARLPGAQIAGAPFPPGVGGLVKLSAASTYG